MKKQNTNKTKYEFGIKTIEILSHSISSQGRPLPEELTFNFNVRVEFKTNETPNNLFVVVHVEIENIKAKSIIGQFSLSCIFNIKNMNKILKIQDNGPLDIPREFLNDLIEISISTTRGVMFSTFKGTFLHNAILPILDVNQFIPLSK